MFAGVHKHSQSRHATAEGIETADEITGERGRGGCNNTAWEVEEQQQETKVGGDVSVGL
jgi:hypothetical protein